VGLGRIERTSQDMTATPEQQRKESRGQDIQDCWVRTTGTGQPVGDNQDSIARTGQLGQDRKRRPPRLVHPGQENRGQDCQNRTARTVQLGQDKGMGQLWQVSWYRMSGTGPLRQDSRDRSA
jgi:hypothetical protein